MIEVGLYDMWAIEYGYSQENDLKPILARVAEPSLQYATDEDTSGPDPLARIYDFSKNPLDYAHSQMKLIRHHRANLLDKFVKDGQSWSQARKGYEMTLMMQTRSISMMANWLGGTYVYRDKKGDKNGRTPMEPVSAQAQRDALKFVIDNTFNDDAFDLTPELLKHLTVDKWLDTGGYFMMMAEPTWPIHDRIMSIQASVLTMLMNPTTMRRIYDNEFLVEEDQESFTLAQLMDSLDKSILTELDHPPKHKYTAQKPMISSLRRNLQREYVKRLIDLGLSPYQANEANKSISNLALMELKNIKEEKVDYILKKYDKKLDPYTKAHLMDVSERIKKALDIQYIRNP